MFDTGTLIAIMCMMPGLYFYMMNWALFLNKRRLKKPKDVIPFGGAIIAAVFLFTPYKLLALTGLTDPGLWIIIRSLFAGQKNGVNERGKTAEEKANSDNNDSGGE